MGTTGNYGFHYPEGTDPPAGNSDTQTLAEDVDAALKTVDDAASALPKILYGQTTVTPSTAEQWLGISGSAYTYYLGSTAVVFPSSFNANPIVIVTVNGSVPGVIIEVSAGNVSTTGFTAYAARGGTSVVTVNWMALGT